MKCPVCKTSELLMTERRGVEIDYCPTCRGVWLDRGELDKLIALESGAHEGDRPSRPSHRDGYDERERQYASGRQYDDRAHHRGYRKKRSLFDMFDFD